ncbi:hypothetical protein [Streptomyces uncialis]|uniref:hypothetical protein n=1 Tax=Streptomyces uncialis TaxID=1048205 RepID=UPI0022520FC3|nr:hypothetical protein [Streptomyces uncialis]MCX4661517.1 hypothetical protein [Streptomyces uncialis]
MTHFAIWYARTDRGRPEPVIVLEDPLGTWSDDATGPHIVDVLAALETEGHPIGSVRVIRMHRICRWRLTYVSGRAAFGAEPVVLHHHEVEDPDLSIDSARHLIHEITAGSGILVGADPAD